MKIIIESHIPYVGDTFKGVADALFLPPEAITPEAVADADALIVRTRTRCNAALLNGSRVKFIATATIGTDHIDLEYCREHGIEVVSAPGCNAPAVAQYVWASVFALRKDINPANTTIGIVGLGHVGSIVARWGRAMGFKVLACDPPLQERQRAANTSLRADADSVPFVALEDIAAQADIITFHTPHTKTGAHPTHHLANEAFFNSLQRQPVIINAARGPVIDTEALLSALRSGKASECVVDCWEGEPALNGELLSRAAIATPHIAGYSVEGKKRATAAATSAALRFFGITDREITDVPPAEPAGIRINRDTISDSYNPVADTEMLKEEFTPGRFEQLRNNYNLRHELGFVED